MKTTASLVNTSTGWPFVPPAFNLITVALCSFVFAELVQAVSPAPDGGYPGGNTAEGQAALLSLTSGTYNTAVGFLGLESNTTGNFNTALGAGALLANTAEQNTATGAGALLSTTTGFENTANGAFALFKNTTGNQNTAVGERALLNNTQGIQNTACGVDALINNTFGIINTAVGISALFFNTEGGRNTAVGEEALRSNTGGNDNTAVGGSALRANTSGNENIAVGSFAGVNLTNGDRNIYIGSSGIGGDNNTIRLGTGGETRTFIAGIFGAHSGFNTVPVMIDATGQLQSINSSRRFKKEIQPMENASEAILRLKPVTFHYKNDNTNTPQFGLIAEEVAEVNPDLVVHDEKGEIYSVRYEAVNAMLLNEFLKEHHKNEAQQGKIDEQDVMISELKSTLVQQQKRFESKLAQQEQQIAALTTDLQRLAADIELNKAESRAVAER